MLDVPTVTRRPLPRSVRTLGAAVVAAAALVSAEARASDGSCHVGILAERSAGLEPLQPAERVAVAAAAFEEACRGFGPVLEAAGDISVVSPERRRSIDLSLATRTRRWLELCPGGDKALRMALRMTHRDGRAHMWDVCGLEQLGVLTRDEWIERLDGMLILPIEAAAAMAEVGIDGELASRVLRGMVGLAPRAAAPAPRPEPDAVALVPDEGPGEPGGLLAVPEGALPTSALPTPADALPASAGALPTPADAPLASVGTPPAPVPVAPPAPVVPDAIASLDLDGAIAHATSDVPVPVPAPRPAPAPVVPAPAPVLAPAIVAAPGDEPDEAEPTTVPQEARTSPVTRPQFKEGGRAEPKWSSAALAAGGSCVVRIRVAPNGRMQKITFLECPDVLKPSVQAAATRSQYQPATDGVYPVAGAFRAKWTVPQ